MWVNQLVKNKLRRGNHGRGEGTDGPRPLSLLLMFIHEQAAGRIFAKAKAPDSC